MTEENHGKRNNMTEENHEITIKFNSIEELIKACDELLRQGYNISLVSGYKVFTVEDKER